MRSVVCRHDVVCRAPITALWDALTDTDGLNRAAGMARVGLTPLSDASAARYLAATRLAGFTVAYAEEPYTWAYQEFFGVRRRMHSGPLTHLSMRFTLRPGGDGRTVVGLCAELVPRHVLLAPVALAGGHRTLRQLAAAIRRLDAALRRGERAAAGPVGRADGAQLERAVTALLAAHPAPLVRRLEAMLRDAPDAQVVRLRPFVLADAWQAPRPAVLRLCADAVAAGALVACWHLICPSCRIPTEQVITWHALPMEALCQLCDVRFAPALVDAVELSFGPDRRLRACEVATYCAGGPARTPHVRAQAVLAAGAEAELRVPLQPGLYTLFVRGGAALPVEVAAGAPAVLARRTDHLTRRPLGRVRPGGAISLFHPGPTALHAKLELREAAVQAVTGRDLAALTAAQRRYVEL